MRLFRFRRFMQLLHRYKKPALDSWPKLVNLVSEPEPGIMPAVQAVANYCESFVAHS